MPELSLYVASIPNDDHLYEGFGLTPDEALAALNVAYQRQARAYYPENVGRVLEAKDANFIRVYPGGAFVDGDDVTVCRHWRTETTRIEPREITCTLCGEVTYRAHHGECQCDVCTGVVFAANY